MSAGLAIEAAEIRDQNGRPAPFAKIDGRWYDIETKPTLLVYGIAVALPVDEAGDYDHQAVHHFTAVVPSDPANGRPDALRLEDAVADERVAALARRFYELASTGRARVGMKL